MGCRRPKSGCKRFTNCIWTRPSRWSPAHHMLCLLGAAPSLWVPITVLRRAFPSMAQSCAGPPKGGRVAQYAKRFSTFSKCSVRAPERAWGRDSPDFVWCCALRASALCVAHALVVALDKCWAFHCPSPFRLRVFTRPWKSWWPNNRLFGT